MLFYDSSCIADNTIQRIADHGVYDLIGTDSAAIVTLFFNGKGKINGFRSFSDAGTDQKAVIRFLDAYREHLLQKENIENAVFEGKTFLALWVRTEHDYHVFNIHCKGSGLFLEKDIKWLKAYQKASIEITRFKNETAQNREYLNTVFDSISSSVFAINRENEVIIANRLAEEELEITDSHSFAHFVDRLPTEHRLKVLEAVNNAIQSTVKLYLNDICIPRKESSKIFNFTISSLKDNKDRITGAIFIATDITAQRLLEMDISRFEQYGLLGEFSAGLAHDIKNPLMNIRGCARIASRNPSDARKTMEMMNIIIHEVDRIDAVTEQTLSLGQMESNKVVAEADLNNILNHCLTIIDRQKFNRRIEFKKNLDPSLPHLLAREADIQQAFLNVLLNALQAIPDAGAIEVSSRYEWAGHAILIEIRDNGTGIPEEIRGNIFKPYFTTKKNGTGLGLFIVKRIMDQYGGTVGLECAVEGGTKCKLQFPVLQ